MNIPRDLSDQIWEYCRLNNITNIDEFSLKLLKQGFTAEKYGSTPQTIEKIVEVEKVIEKVVEVPVDKIIEVEVVVEKEVYLTDDSRVEELVLKIKELETERDNYKKESMDFEMKWNEVSDKLREELKKKNKRDIYGEY
jgi:hypothetical protein